jgi:ureidoglycolate hydrolase
MSYREIKYINKENFFKYGVVLEMTENAESGFEILLSEKDYGWRIALFKYNTRKASVLENHPTSKESFEPVSGVSLLIVAENKSPEQFEIFILDKPICLYEGVWHQVVTLSQSSMVKITENIEVTSEFYYPENEIKPVVLI